jgi:hypothetical protein
MRLVLGIVDLNCSCTQKKRILFNNALYIELYPENTQLKQIAPEEVNSI